jgi:hypothetical protein
VSVAVAEELAQLAVKAPASAHLSRLLSFVRAHERLDAAGDEDTRSRHLRARAAVLRIAEGMRAAAVGEA